LLPAHLVRDHEDQLVALLLRHQRQADAGVAGGALDQGVAGLDVAALFGGLDHAHADAVLDRTARVLALELQVQLAGTGIQAPGLDDGRVGDELEDGGMDRHAALALKARSAIIASTRGLPAAIAGRPGDRGRRRPTRMAAAAREWDGGSVLQGLEQSREAIL